tara:strand:+ start:401 stop:1204 length:804 start_codon:yes stop_codon:yes gene_type:complete
MGVFAGPNIVEDGLMLYLDAADPKSYPGSGTTWFDLSGNGRHATLRNSSAGLPSHSTNNKGYFDFTPNGSYATVPHDSEIASAAFDDSWSFTIGGWLNIHSFINYGTLINKAASGWYSGSTNGIWIEAGNGGRILCISSTSETSNPSGYLHAHFLYPGSSGNPIVNQIVENSWLNINYVGLGTNSTKVYINGEDTNQAGNGGHTISRTRNTNTADIAIGTRSATSGSATSTPQTDGFISSVHVYGRALSADEIKQNYEATKGRFGTL